MPTYVYKREDGTTFEVMQRITEDPLELCPTTGQKVKRVIGAGAGLIFKGSGFYITDYARKDSSSASSASSSPVSTDTKSNGTTEKKTDAGSASASTSKPDSKGDSSD